jgi:hypothetical protein
MGSQIRFIPGFIKIKKNSFGFSWYGNAVDTVIKLHQCYDYEDDGFG